MFMCEDLTSCTDFSHHHVVDEITTLLMRSPHSATVLHSYSCYIVVASIFLVLSTVSCKAIHGMASVRSQDLPSACNAF